MVTIDEARPLVAEWNATHVDRYFVPFEIVEEAIHAYYRRLLAIAMEEPPVKVHEFTVRHWAFANRIPDELLLMLCEDEDDATCPAHD